MALFKLVWIVLWIPQCRDASTEEFISDVKYLFSRWHWYDDKVTEYQVWYELDNDIGGKIPSPMK